MREPGYYCQQEEERYLSCYGLNHVPPKDVAVLTRSTCDCDFVQKSSLHT